MSELNLRPEDLDRLGQALITLTKELWVTKDRVRILEAALVEAGVIACDAVESLQPNDQLKASLENDRAQLINQILKALETKE
jgi:mRNA-degrading endonuclease toxin of MazEF toxin-antitoxin module